MVKYGYARVSTAGQDLETQIETLRKQGCKETNIFAEKFTGTKTKQRKELQALLDVPFRKKDSRYNQAYRRAA